MPVQQQQRPARTRRGGPAAPPRPTSTRSSVNPSNTEPLLRPVLDGSRYHEQYDHGSAEAQLSEPGAARPSRRPPGRAPQGTGRPAAAAGRGPARPPRPGNRQPAGRRARRSRSPSSPTTCGGFARRAWCGSSAAAARPSTSSATPGSRLLLPLLDRITGHLRPPARPSLAASRTCYDHLAGPLGVGLYRAMVGHRALEERPDGTVELGEAASPTLAALGVAVAAVAPGRRRLAFQCLDATERAPHLAGALGDAVAAALLTGGWVERNSRQPHRPAHPGRGPRPAAGARPDPRARAGLADGAGVDAELGRRWCRRRRLEAPADDPGRVDAEELLGEVGEAGVDRAAAGGQRLGPAADLDGRGRAGGRGGRRRAGRSPSGWPGRRATSWWRRSRPRRRRWCPRRR